jgi:hypothetical protein
LRANFFGLTSVFSKDAKDGRFNLKEMDNFKDFGDFSEFVIEGQLKGRYLKELLHILDALKLPLVDTKSNDTFAMLIEMVQRRNIHVHNRGYVDDRYLEGNQWNIHKLHHGEIAKIEHPYWADAQRLCTFCVDALATWVEAGAGFYEHHAKP